MDGHRRYADDPEPGWYSGQSQYDSSLHERPSGAFRLPEQRDDEYGAPSPYVTSDPVSSTGGHSQEQLRIPVRGPEYPTIRPGGGTPPVDVAPAGTYGGGVSPVSPTGTYGGGSPPVSAVPHAGGAAGVADEPTGMVAPVGRFASEPRPGEAVYRTRRPFSAVLVAIVTAVLMVPAIMLLVQAMFDDQPLARGLVPGVLLTLGLPLTGMGLFALAGGGVVGRDAWLRPPVAYLPVGLVILVAAGLAAA
ncbi:MAG TPA: hypothetical protein VFH03_03500 [Actinoplanes sp.]|nr:hypothetical protein [Actinoplanes sp.]